MWWTAGFCEKYTQLLVSKRLPRPELYGTSGHNAAHDVTGAAPADTSNNVWVLFYFTLK
jgi:hypothetical protein